MQSASCNTFDKYTLNKSRFLIFVIFGVFAILRYLAQFEYLGNLIIITVTLMPFTLILFYVVWVFFKDRYDHESYVIMNSCHVFLNLLLKLSTAILILFIVFFPTAWLPIWVFLKSLKNLLTLETYFLFSSYIAVAVVALGAIIVLIRFYQMSQGTYQKSLAHLIKKTLYSTFFLLAFLSLFSIFAYPQAYAPLTDAAGTIISQVFGMQGNDSSSIFATLSRAVKDTKNNLFGEIATTNQQLAATLTESKDNFTKSIADTATSLKDKVSTGGGDITGSLVLSGSKADLTVEGKTTLKDTIPAENDTYNLGESGQGWNNIYAHNLWGSSLLSVGDGSSLHGLTGPDDLLISGGLEVNGATYFDGPVYGLNLGSADSLPLTGGTLTGELTINSSDDKLLSLKKNGTEKAYIDKDGIISVKGVKLNGVTRKTWVDPNYSYDAIVDPNDNGDYTNLNDAIDAGAQRIFLKNGNYKLTRDAIMTDPTKSFALVGESKNGVIIDPNGYYFGMEGAETIKNNSNANGLNFSKGSNVVTLTGDIDFIASGVEAGMYLRIGQVYDGFYFKIKSVDSATQLTTETANDYLDIVDQGKWGIAYAYEDPVIKDVTFNWSGEGVSARTGRTESRIFEWGNDGSDRPIVPFIRLKMDNIEIFNTQAKPAVDASQVYGLNDLTLNYSGGWTGEWFNIYIDSIGNTDTFAWTNDGGATYTQNVPITGSSQTLSNGVAITFGAITGHSVNDGWSFQLSKRNVPPNYDAIGENWDVKDLITYEGVYAPLTPRGSMIQRNNYGGNTFYVYPEQTLINNTIHDIDFDYGSGIKNNAVLIGNIFQTVPNINDNNFKTVTWLGNKMNDGTLIPDKMPSGLTLDRSTVETANSYGLNITNNSTTVTDAINKYGGYISSTGDFTNGSTLVNTNNYGLYIDTPTGAVNNYALYSAGGNNFFGGNVGIGDSTPDTTLKVVGTLCVKADDSDCALGTDDPTLVPGTVYAGNFITDAANLTPPDYVFDGSNPSYQLQSLDELRTYIAMYNHLPGIASAEEIKSNGLDYNSMLMGLLQKTEENTLYILQNNDQLKTIDNTLTLNGINDNVDNLATSTENSIGKLKKDLSDLTTQETANTAILATLQDQINQIQALTNQDLTLAKLDTNTQNIDLLRLTLGLDRVQNTGDIDILGKLSAQTLETGELAIKVIDPAAATIGQATIPAGETSVVVETTGVSADSNIFVTPTEPVKIGVNNIVAAKEFTISIDEPQKDDVGVNWWIIKNNN